MDLENEVQIKVAKKAIITIINLLGKIKDSTRIDDFASLFFTSDFDANIPIYELLLGVESNEKSEEIEISDAILIDDTDLATCFRIIAHYQEAHTVEQDKSLLAINDRIFQFISTSSQSDFCHLLKEILHLSEDATMFLFRNTVDYLYNEAYQTKSDKAQLFLSTALAKLKPIPSTPIDLQSFLHDCTRSQEDKDQDLIKLFNGKRKKKKKKKKKSPQENPASKQQKIISLPMNNPALIH